MMNFKELDDITRRYMLEEFEAEEAGGNPYRAKGLSEVGLSTFPNLMRQAIVGGTELTLTQTLFDWRYWNRRESYTRSGITRLRDVNLGQTSERLGITEFNTWYVRGLSKRLLTEGISHCKVYRAAIPKWESGSCSQHEGQVLPVVEVYEGHRASYWPEPGRPSAMTLPYGYSCHHTICRVGEN